MPTALPAALLKGMRRRRTAALRSRSLRVVRSRESRANRAALAVVASVTVLVTGVVVPSGPATADATTGAVDNLRTAWDSNEAALAPSSVGSADFGQLFAAQLDGQVYAQPLVANGVVFTATENDKIYGLDAVTGAVLWQRDIGPAWPASAIGCGDLTPNIGVTGTPVYDPSTRTVYFTAKVNDGADQNTPHWYLHAVDIATGTERAGFPSTIAGTPSNDSQHPFNARTAMQRPGLVLLNGVVYAAFASHCDYGPYVGYIVGVNASSGKQTTLWSAQSGGANSGSGIWQSGGGIVSDGAGRLIVTTGNGVSPPKGPGSAPPANLAESVVRLNVGADGSLAARDFFSPVNNTNLDNDDADLGAAAPMAVPDGYGTAAHPHLLVQGGKDGRVFLLDRDDLGGDGQGANTSDAVLQTAGPYNGVWGAPAFWGGDGGYVYFIENGGYLRAYKVGVAGSGLPALTAVGASSSTWGFGSGSPIVTSSGTTSGSSLVWAVYSSGGSGANAQLRAYAATPTKGVLPMVWSAPIGTAAKFSRPASDNGRVYVGTRDGRLYGFGRPASAALTGTPTDFGSVPVGSSAARTVTVTATRALTVTGISAAAPFTVGSVTLPRTLAAGATLAVPVTYRPSTAGAASGALSFGLSDSAVPLLFDLHGTGTQPGLTATPAALSFGSVPTTGKVTSSVNITNSGTATVTITSTSAATAPFSSPGLPAVGAKLAPGASVSVPVTFAPSTTGSFTGSVGVGSDAGGVSVPVTGTGVAGAAHLALTPSTVDFGSVPLGTTATSTFTIADTGNLLLTLTKAAPPTAPFAATPPVSEGQQLTPGQSITQTMTFSPTALGAVSGTYVITGNDGQGAQSVTVKGTGIAAPTTTTTTVPAPAAGGWTVNGSAAQSGTDTVLTTTASTYQAGSVVYPTPVPTAGLHVSFTAQLSGGSGGADGLAFALLDPTQNAATALGGNGGALGYGSLKGVAVALDTFQNAADPSSNFVGIATGATGTRSDSLTYVATQPAASSLRTGTHTVDVSVAAGTLTVRLDGGAPLSASVALPATALLAFTGATGYYTDVHTVRSVSITVPAAPGAAPPAPAPPAPVPPAPAPPVPAPSKAIVSAAGVSGGGACLSGAAGYDPSTATLAACASSTTQEWTVPGDGTLRASGKCLDVAGAAVAVGTSVRMWTCNGTSAQVWTAAANSTLVNPGSGLCLTTVGGALAAGTGVVISTCASPAVPGQRWALPG